MSNHVVHLKLIDVICKKKKNPIKVEGGDRVVWLFLFKEVCVV